MKSFKDYVNELRAARTKAEMDAVLDEMIAAIERGELDGITYDEVLSAVF